MRDDEKVQVVQAIAVTAEILGHELGPSAQVTMADDLGEYPLEVVLSAIAQCRREVSRLTLAAILQRVEAADGRPEPNEAWSIASGAADERATVVWTDEIQAAFAAAKPLLDNRDDKVGARMAFLAAYERLVAAARRQRIPVSWQTSLGWDMEQRESAVSEAIRLGRLTNDQALRLLPSPVTDEGVALQSVLMGKPLPALEDHSSPERDEQLRRLRELRESIVRQIEEGRERRALEERRRRAEFEDRRAQVLTRLYDAALPLDGATKEQLDEAKSKVGD